jgi:hypothetical protein
MVFNLRATASEGGSPATDRRSVCVGSSNWICRRTEFRKEGGSIPPDKVLHADLTGPETVPRLDGKLQLESKKDMKRRGQPSPNRADALALSFAYPVAQQRQFSNAGLLPRPRILTDYDPLATP